MDTTEVPAMGQRELNIKKSNGTKRIGTKRVEYMTI